MNTSLSKKLNLRKSKLLYRTAPAIFFSLLLLTACQKDPEPEATDTTTAETSTQTTPVTTNINVDEAKDSNADDAQNVAQTDTDSERDMSLTELDKDLSDTTSTANDSAEKPNPEQAIKGAQITDVRYKNAAGESLSVVFETSAAGMLNAIITRPNQPKMTLSAPEGQGNNPTYQSADGSIQLVSHAGGGTIDLIRNNKVTSFDAVSAEAEVITE
ncbi:MULTISPECIES: hypothetical protein [Psychrobacter]|jgi:hypothetical protein|uniref:hypothetical protein n=1 Tax=Psychrobacter TaxID=497 RepID=UPI00086CF90E|nr:MULTISPECIES: hypothetical protein [Psychrobacter]MBA6244778.1 hypothetical protein [Psychrobacter sp. Urea-trap-18]MBA6285745.1 hypothetical protein [Psychrobacter sp. Urea-trap-16]MBA6318783.1 hypothetical protein [Psychrobacter sp. Urea-trap-20]MBA6334830.1 hypothetical protein [Psychrobacter sp. Urea-trap-19]OEH67329.1 MAG: hypothetical protein BAX61_10345 [Psychrobacter sp. B29-1]|tara:strand:+ start:22700 stop:23344 length:645 start_codon:yes stop_codon:yes gene_type:complete